MILNVSSLAKDVLSEQGYDIPYGACPLKGILNRELLNPLSCLVLEGSIQEGDTVYVRTRGEAENMQQQQQKVSPPVHHGDSNQNLSLSWISSNPSSNDKNDVVKLRNHVPPPVEYDEVEQIVDTEGNKAKRFHDTNRSKINDDDDERFLDAPQSWQVHK